MRRRRESWTRRRLAVGVTLAAVLTPMVALLTASPAAATTVLVSDQTLAPGDTTTVTVSAPTGAVLIAVTSCGNADAGGVPLAPSLEGDLDNCFDASGAGLDAGLVLQPVTDPGGEYLIPYRWTEPIGPNATRCVATGAFDCRIVVLLIGNDLMPFDETAVPISPPGVDLTISGTTDAVYDGTLLDFTLSGLLTTGEISFIATCGNADASGEPFPVETILDRGQRCSTPFNDQVFAGSGNVVDGGGVIFDAASPSTVFSGTITWRDPAVTFFWPGATCIPDGNFPCAVMAGPLSDPARLTLVDVQPGPRPTIVAESITVTEGESAMIVGVPVTLSEPIAAPVTVDWATRGGTAESFTDFASLSGTLAFAPGETRAEIVVVVWGDTLDEFDEFFAVGLSNPRNGVVGGFYGLGFVEILDNDPDITPMVTPGFVQAFEGDAGSAVRNVPLTLSEPTGKPITVDWRTVDSSATAGTDFVADSGQVTFAPGQTQASIPITILGDTESEPDELALIVTSNWVNAAPGGYFGLGGVGIIDDEAIACIDRLGPGANLVGCDLSGETIADADLTGADLTDADLTGARLGNVDLSGATLDSANLSATIITGSTFDDASAVGVVLDEATVVGTSMAHLFAPNASIDNATIAGSTLPNAVLTDASIQSTAFLVGDLSTTTLDGITWGPSTACPDGTASGQHGNTCWRVKVGFRPANTSSFNSPVVLTDDQFVGSFHRSGRFNPADLTPSSRFGGPVVGVDAGASLFFDSDFDGERDQNYFYPVSGAPLTPGTSVYCASAVLSSGDTVYGCNSLTVLTSVPTTTTMPPISPPASPPTSPPVSGGADPGLLPLLAGPLGLMATASGIGLIFLIGSTRASTALDDARRREDEPDADDLQENTTS
jgi:Calx-beta domain/Pentapeptide repeats (8 copies)